MAPPDISIVVPNLDSLLVGETLEALAVLGAPGPGVEVLIVGRDSPGLVPRAPQETGVRLLETAERLNPAAARNRGVEAARGHKILFTDADCRPQEGWIEALDAALEETPVAGGAVSFPLTGNVWALADNIASFHELLAGRPSETDSQRPLGSLNLAVRREAWDKVGPFDEELTTSEDFDWVLRARQAGLATAFVAGAVVHHAAVRHDRRALVEHARWYGHGYHDFRRRHPQASASGPTWRNRRTLTLAAPVKAWTSALGLFRRHRDLPWRALPGVVAFKRAWYRAILESWPAEGERKR